MFDVSDRICNVPIDYCPMINSVSCYRKIKKAKGRTSVKLMKRLLFINKMRPILPFPRSWRV